MPKCNCQETSVCHRVYDGYCRTYRNLVAALSGLVLAATIGACASPQRHAQHLARNYRLDPLVLQGTIFRHHAFAAVRGTPGLLVLFIDGDGSPWTGGGYRVASDPTSRQLVALDLAGLTPGSVLYLGRPCYLDSSRPAECSARLWTSERYSPEVVASMSAAAARYIAQQGFEQVLLVGYSGGATLAALMADSLPRVSGFVSIAGNLDPDSWTRLHGYLPLQGSLNPSLQPALPASLPQWYLLGGQDKNVPAAASGRYLERVAPDRIWRFPQFDHECCWVREWPALFARIATELSARRTLGSHPVAWDNSYTSFPETRLHRSGYALNNSGAW